MAETSHAGASGDYTAGRSRRAPAALATMRNLLTRPERHRLIRLILALPLLGTIDALGLAAIIAVFLHVLGVHSLPGLHALCTWLAGALHLAISERALGLMLLIAIAVARFAAGVFTQYLIFRFSYAVQARLSGDFLAAFLATDVDYIAGKDKAFGVQIVFNECARYASGVLQNGLQVAYESLTLLLFAGVLIHTSPVISLLFIVAAAIVFLVVRYVSQNFTRLLGARRLRSDGARFSLISEAFQGFDEIAVYGLAPGLVRRYEAATSESLHTTLLQQLINLLPRNLFEFLVVLALLVIALSAGGAMSPDLLGTLAILLGAAFRCMPSINRILASGQMIAFEIPVVQELSALRQEAARARRPVAAAAARTRAPATVSIPAVRVHRSGHNGDFQLNVAPLELGPADLVLIMGDSGCGKTTYLASVAGLLNQAQHRRTAQVRVSYAPQTAFVLNDSLEANITLTGLLTDKVVDEQRLQESMRVAQLLHPDSARPIIAPGTRLDGSGANLSGGQRQRIALARALYFDSELLILDEVTSGLDEPTEQLFIDAYRASFLRRPTLFVTHRSRLVAAATRVFRLEHGTLTEGIPSRVDRRTFVS